MGLYTEIDHLKKIENPQAGVLSILLSTKPSERDQWKLHLKNGLKQLEKKIEEEGNQQKISAFSELKEKVESSLENVGHRLLRSIVIYAEGGNGFFEMHFLQLDVENEFVYSDAPKIEQLETLDKNFPKTGIIVSQMDIITVYNTRLGEVEDVFVFELDLDTDNWRKFQGRSARANASSSSQTDQYDSRKEKQIRRFYREVSNELSSLYKEYGWDQLVIIGHQRTANLLLDEIEVDVSRTINKNMGGASEEEVLNATFEY